MATLILVSIYTLIALIVEDFLKWGLSTMFGFNDMSLTIVIMSMCWIVLIPAIAIGFMVSEKLRQQFKEAFGDFSNN